METLRKLLNNEIKLRQKKFLIQSRSFAEMLEESIRKYQNRAIEAAAVIEELIQLANQMGESTLTTIARELVEAVRNSVTIDWTESDPSTRSL